MIMSAGEVRVEELLGRVVRSAGGLPVGRIEDLRARPEGDDYVVYEVVLGELGLMAKIFGAAAQLPTFQALGLGRGYRTRAIPWDWLDLTDPERPRFRSSAASEEV